MVAGLPAACLGAPRCFTGEADAQDTALHTLPAPPGDCLVHHHYTPLLEDDPPSVDINSKAGSCNQLDDHFCAVGFLLALCNKYHLGAFLNRRRFNSLVLHVVLIQHHSFHLLRIGGHSYDISHCGCVVPYSRKTGWNNACAILKKSKAKQCITNYLYSLTGADREFCQWH